MSQTNDNVTSRSRKRDNLTPMWRANRKAVEPVVWSSVDSAAIGLAIDAVTRAGGAIMFGVTSDGGAYSLCILQGDEKLKEYPSNPAAASEALAELTDWYVNFKL